MELVTGYAGARNLSGAIAAGYAAAVAVAAGFDARDQDVVRSRRSARIVTGVASRDLGIVRSVRKGRVREKRRRESNRHDLPRNVAVTRPADLMTVRTGAALEQVLGNVERANTRFGGCAITLGARQSPSGTPQALLDPSYLARRAGRMPRSCARPRLPE